MKLHSSLRQRQLQTIVAYEADLVDNECFKKIGQVTLVVKLQGQYVNQNILEKVNREADSGCLQATKKIISHDHQWLKITQDAEGSSEDSDDKLIQIR